MFCFFSQSLTSHKPKMYIKLGSRAASAEPSVSYLALISAGYTLNQGTRDDAFVQSPH